MKTRIYGKDLELTEAIKEYTNEKIGMIEKYYDNIQNIDVELARILSGHNKGKVFRVEWNVSVPGQLLRVEKKEEDLYKAIDKVKDHMVRELRNYKEKQRDRDRGKA